MAVIVVPSLLFMLFATTPAASAPGARHTAAGEHRAQTLKMKLMSYDQARQEAKLVGYAQAVEAQELQTYLQEVAYLKAMAANPVSAIPAAWLPTAMCEEGGRNDPTSGYFGIREWHGFDGYPTAGSAPLSVQLAWEARYIGGPPDAPGECHSY
jgi:hypothetical protein